MRLRFAFSEPKALECLAYLASKKPGLTPLYVGKVMFYAEKWHLNRYGRPIVADTYIAMPRGPVPSTIKDFLDENWNWVERPEQIDGAIRIDHSSRFAKLMPGSRAPNLDVLSESDIECLDEALEFCVRKRPDELSRLSHDEKAWQRAPANGPMNYVDFVDDTNPHKNEVLQMAEETAARGLL